MRAFVVITTLTLGWLSAPFAHAVQDCKVGDKPINLNNGHETQTLTGRVICRDRDTGEVRLEVPYVKGQVEGVDMMITFEGARLETTYKAGKRHGRQRKYDSAGKLLEETHYANDAEAGETRMFHPNGKVRVHVRRGARDEDAFRIEYDGAGRPVEMYCGLQISTRVGRAPCRYGRRTEVLTLFGSDGKPRQRIRLKDGLREGATEHLAEGKVVRFETFRAGRLHGLTEERDETGTVRRRAVYADGEKDGPEERFFTDGKLDERTSWRKGAKVVIERMWQNGQRRSRLTYEDEGKRELNEEFWDNGKPRLLEPRALTPSRWGRPTMAPHGTVKRWHENGQLAFEGAYANGEQEGNSTHWFPNGVVARKETWSKGRLAALKQWDENGKLEKDEAYHEDGSRR